MVRTLQRQESVGVPGLLTSHQGGRPAGCSEVSGNPSWWAEPSAFTPQAAENCSQVSSEEWTRHSALGSPKAEATECPSAGEWTDSGQAVVSHSLSRQRNSIQTEERTEYRHRLRLGWTFTRDAQ